jgi:AraC-like DNA-binding protein
MGLLLQTASPVPPGANKGGWRAVEYIRGHYKEPVTVADLANAAAMSPSNLYAVFKKELGCSPIAFLNRYRMSLAAQRLCETDEAVCEIGYGVGVMDPLYFSKLFKQTFGTSPRDYREMHTRSAIKT